MRFSEINLDSSLTKNNRQRLQIYPEPNPGLIVCSDAEEIEISCGEIAAVAWGIYSNLFFFQQRFGVDARYRDDFNGGGDQSIEIGIGKDVGFDNYIIRVIYTSFGKGDYVYEADLLMDGSRDYHPTRNLGKAQFFPSCVFVNMASPDDVLAWVNDRYLQWKQELTRICKPHSTLSEWVNSHLDMAIKCRNFACSNSFRVMSNNDLRAFAASGVTLEDLQNRLVCSKCKQRRPRVTPF